MQCDVSKPERATWCLAVHRVVGRLVATLGRPWSYISSTKLANKFVKNERKLREVTLTLTEREALILTAFAERGNVRAFFHQMRNTPRKGDPTKLVYEECSALVMDLRFLGGKLRRLTP